MKSKFATGIALGVVGTLLTCIAIWLILTYTGAYNVAASAQHADVVRWTLDTTMHRSVANRAGGAAIPEEVSETVLAEGAEHYAASCAHCHGAPGAEPAHWSRGMRPTPPHLVEAASEWTLEEIHWIITHGIKMTGMPAFGEHHPPEEIGAIAAFVNALPGLAADDYARLSGSATEPSGRVPPATGETSPEPQPQAPLE